MEHPATATESALLATRLVLTHAKTHSAVAVINPVEHRGALDTQTHRENRAYASVNGLMAALSELVCGFASGHHALLLGTETEALNARLVADIAACDSSALCMPSTTETFALNNLYDQATLVSTEHMRALIDQHCVLTTNGALVDPHAFIAIIAVPLAQFDAIYAATHGLPRVVLIVYCPPDTSALSADSLFLDEPLAWIDCCATARRVPGSPLPRLWFYFDHGDEGPQVGWLDRVPRRPENAAAPQLNLIDRNVISDPAETQFTLIKRMLHSPSISV